MGKYLGPSKIYRGAMSGVVMTERATRLDRTSIIPLTVEDQNSEPIKKMK